MGTIPLKVGLWSFKFFRGMLDKPSTRQAEYIKVITETAFLNPFSHSIHVYWTYTILKTLLQALRMQR